jgi:MFS family permease
VTGRRRPVAALLGVARSTPALRSRSFRLLASGQFVSNVGDGLYAVALPWYVLAHHGGPILLGAVLACYGIPRTCLIMVGGHLADRIGPWRVMMGADLGRLVIAAALAVLAATRQPSLLTLAPIAFGLGAGEGLFLPASFSIMPRLVDEDELQSGNALLSAGTQLATFAGPALGGVVVAAVSSAAGFGLDALTFAVSALTLWRLGATVAARQAAGVTAGTEPRGPGRPGVTADAAGTADAAQAESWDARREGIVMRRDADMTTVAAPAETSRAETSRAETSRAETSRAETSLAGTSAADASQAEPGSLCAFIRRERVVPLLMAINIAANLGSAGATEVALPLLARNHLHAGAGGYGSLIAGFGIGALAGSLVATRLNRFRRPAFGAGFIFLAQTPLMIFLPLAPDLALAWVMIALWGGLNMSANITTQTAFQRWAPPGMIGRLSGLLLVTSYGMFPVSVALAGFVVHRFGPGSFFLLSAVTMAATLVLALSQRAFREWGTQPASAEPVMRIAEPARG